MNRWKLKDRIKPPQLTHAQFERLIQMRRKKIMFEPPFNNTRNRLKNKDWFEAIVGDEGDGKSQLGLLKCSLYDKSFESELEQRIIYNMDQLMDLHDTDRHGLSVLIDEGIFLANTKRSMENKIVEFEDEITSCRYLNNYFALCIPELSLLTKKFRKRRMLSVAWCISQGIVWLYNRDSYFRVILWEQNQDPNTNLPKWKEKEYNIRKRRPRGEYRYFPRELIASEDERSNNRQIVSNLWIEYSKIKASRNKERHKKKKRVTGFNSRDLADMYGVTIQTAISWLKRVHSEKPEAINELPNGKLVLNEDKLDILKKILKK